jgi:hypothetical protein
MEDRSSLDDSQERAEYIKGLRALADALEQHPELRLPYDGRSTGISVFPHGDQRAELADWARVLPGRKEKTPRNTYFDLHGSFHGLKITVVCQRDEVCERHVVGTREVEVEEPDPAAVAALPKVKRTEILEDVEWICGSILGPDDPQRAELDTDVYRETVSP